MVRKNKHIIRIFALVLTLVMLLSTVTPALAITITTDEEQLTGADIVSEDISKRDSFTKHFLTGDGSYFAVTYTEQVNYLDDDGNWKEVDNTFSTNFLTGEKTTNNDKFKVTFANKANKDKLVTIKTDDIKLSWGLSVSENGTDFSPLNKVKVSSSDSASKTIKTTTDAQNLGKAVSSVTYENAFGDYLDVRYGVSHLKVKEDIILNRKSVFKSYKVTYNTNNISGIYTITGENGTVTFCRPDGDVLFEVAAPVMYDSVGAFSSDIAVSVTQGSKTIEIIYTPDADWLNSDERVYPVTLDPSVSSSRATTNIWDVSSHYYGVTDTTGDLYLGEDTYNYIKFLSVPEIQSGYNILGIDIILYAYSFQYPILSPYDPTTCTQPISVAPVYTEWTENNFYYSLMDNNLPSTGPGTSYQVCTVSELTAVTGEYKISLPVLSLIQTGDNALTYSIYSSFFASSHGFKIELNYDCAAYAYSSENASTLKRPTLVVRYAPPQSTPASGIESHQYYRIFNSNGTALTYAPNATGKIDSQPLDISSSYQVYYVTYSSTYNSYSIRPHFNTSYLLGHEGANQKVGINMSYGDFYWKIQNYDSLYLIQADDYIGHYLISNGNDQAPTLSVNSQAWSFQKVESITPESGSYWFHIGDTFLLPNSSPRTISNTNVISDDNGLITIKKEGMSIITTTSYSMTIQTILPDGEYFIKNRHSNNLRYIQIDDNASSDQDGALMELWEFNGEDNQIWEFSYISDGFYHIVSKASGHALMVNYNKQNIGDVKIRQGIYYPDETTNYNQQWQISFTTHGSYKIANRASINAGTDLVMCMGLTVNEDSDGVNVLNSVYEDNESYRDEWYLGLCVKADVELEGQINDNWCWVAAARMFSKNYYPSISVTQNQAVTYVKGSEIDVGGSINESKQAIEYFVSTIPGASIDITIKNLEIYTEDTLQQFLNDGHVIYISRGWYSDINNSNSRNGGHATLLYGYMIMNDECWLMIRDPLPVGEGETYLISYEKLVNGQNSRSSEDDDDGVWEGCIVCLTSYGSNTIPYYFG